MKRYLIWATRGLVLLGVPALIVWHNQVWYWIEVHTGTVNEPGPYYGFFSGFGSDLSELAIVGGMVGLLRKHNCHVQGCWRIGRHQVEGTPWAVCRRHHPDPKVREGLSAHHILRAHQEHLARHRDAPGGNDVHES